MALATVSLAGSISGSWTIGRFTLQPGTTYSASYLDFSDIYIIAAIARGTLVFNDGVNTLNGFVTNPCVAQMIQNWNQANNDNVPGADSVTIAEPAPIQQ